MADESEQYASGFLTDQDREWLAGGDIPNVHDRKWRCKKATQHALTDVERIVNTNTDDVEGLAGLEGLFDDLEDNTDLSAERCAQNLIALAFVIASSPIDYNEIANEVELSDRGYTNLSLPVDDVLTFHRALAEGVKKGKKIVGDETPNNVHISSNTNLYKNPTASRVRPEAGSLNTNIWKGENVRRLGATNVPDDPDKLDYDEVSSRIAAHIGFNVEEWLRQRESMAQLEQENTGDLI